MKKQLGWALVSLLALVVLSLFVACENETNETTGTLLLEIADSPFPIEWAKEANVTVDKIEVRRKSTGQDGPFLTLTDVSGDYNLLDLRNGITAELVEVEVPTGSYNLIRLYVSEANVVLFDSTIHNLTIPSGAQTGIKIFVDPPIQVEGGLTSELLLDFDVNKSFVVQGNPDTPAGITGFSFKPVIRAVNLSSSGRITGLVTDTSSTALSDAYVWAENDSVVSFTLTDSTGQYALIGIQEGTYTVKGTKTDYDTVSTAGIQVVAANKTKVDFQLTPK